MDVFSDIMDLPHHVSAARRQMPLADRAAQFSAFAALTGYDEDIEETARAARSEDDLAALDTAFQRLLTAESERPAVTVTYFQPDARKAGGRYVTYTGVFRHYDAEEGRLLFADASVIPAENISEIVFL